MSTEKDSGFEFSIKCKGWQLAIAIVLVWAAFHINDIVDYFTI